jgi:hypothetical protein
MGDPILVHLCRGHDGGMYDGKRMRKGYRENRLGVGGQGFSGVIRLVFISDAGHAPPARRAFMAMPMLPSATRLQGLRYAGLVQPCLPRCREYIQLSAVEGVGGLQTTLVTRNRETFAPLLVTVGEPEAMACLGQ